VTTAAAPEATAPATTPDARHELRLQLSELRSRALQGLLNVTAIVASVAWFPGVYAAWSSGLMGVVVIDTVMWAAVIVLALWRSLADSVRAAVFCTLWLLFSVTLLWILGPVGAGAAWLLALPVLTTLFYGRRGAVVGIGAIVTVGVVFALALARAANGVGIMATLGEPAYTHISWLASIGSVAFLGVLLAVAVHMLLRGLQDALVAERRVNEALRQTMEERTRLQAAAVEGAKAQALGTLASGIAHDLNNLLVPMLVAGGEARAATVPGTPQRRHLDLVLASAERARTLAGRVLAFMRSAPEERRPVAMAPLVREVAGLLRSGTSPSIRVAVEIEADAEDVHVDALADEVHRVLMNLGSNAARAVAERPAGGTVTFELATRMGVDGAAAVVRVRDDGPGVPEGVRERLFEPYVTDRAAGDGTGLGLAIVRHVVTGLSGRVSLLASGATGTTFEIVVPTSTSTSATAAPPAAEPDEGSGDHADEAVRGATVLVVDDEPLVRATTAEVLKSLGYVVVEVGTPEDALARVYDAPASIDVVVSDVAMPRMSGLDLVRALRTVRAGLPVVLMSGRIDDALVIEAEREGVSGLVAKPFTRGALGEAVAAALDVARRVDKTGYRPHPDA